MKMSADHEIDVFEVRQYDDQQSISLFLGLMNYSFSDNCLSVPKRCSEGER